MTPGASETRPQRVNLNVKRRVIWQERSCQSMQLLMWKFYIGLPSASRNSKKFLLSRFCNGAFGIDALHPPQSTLKIALHLNAHDTILGPLAYHTPSFVRSD